ncbi:ROK family transcriptional regulator [Paraburkholderia megapolitana]|uniref:Sugar kinase of the NBD/HSP70 family, may contain an N-terminal HTH domain n=1 Tax=Paraburkholderia megapolitana TaxID=420953 RepID=A0A1I3E775_9BURK|nr:ROK family transcriptional regulator [Paraburkholderia megapolitana]QDQ79949.1 ROK family transcriptional regulator [Paraburkholderia megapolitana]SFH94738.1 Sugar kinase of the NBD/HSP70 family, may contain an N-terminal HTH domain [Paraburkholderia megapolitana]
MNPPTRSPPRRTVGSNQVGMRQFNERIVLQAIRLHGPLPKADVGRLTRLSMQTVSMIVERLISDGLLAKQPRVRGRIGQPSVPIALRPDGAFTIGIKVGRRSLDVLAMDFTGNVCCREVLDYAYPDPRMLFPALESKLARVNDALGARAAKVVGVGVAAPLWLGGWRDFLGAPQEALDAWHDIDIRSRIEAMTGLPVEFAKDTTAACAAELVMGQGRGIHNFLYLFVGTFIGGGLVIDGRLHSGPHDNAGAVGSIPLPGATRQGTQQPARQLLHAASGFVLEQAIAAAGEPPAAAHDHRALSADLWRHTEQWLDTACPAIAGALTNAAALLDLDAVVIDGELDRQLVREIIRRTERVLDGFEWEGIVRPQLLEGTIGADARAMGGAILPLYAHFAPVHELFLKPAAEADQ